MAFLDINPVHKGHALIVPKTPFENIFDGDPETFGYMAQVAMKLGKTIKAAVEADGINLIMNNGAAARQEVFHAHIHIVPRYSKDGSYQDPTHVEYAEGESQLIATQIMAALED